MFIKMLTNGVKVAAATGAGIVSQYLFGTRIGSDQASALGQASVTSALNNTNFNNELDKVTLCIGAVAATQYIIAGTKESLAATIGSYTGSPTVGYVCSELASNAINAGVNTAIYYAYDKTFSNTADAQDMQLQEEIRSRSALTRAII